MGDESFPYCIPDKRDLSSTELALLRFLLRQVDEIDIEACELKVVARCGCGVCPTILLSSSVDEEPVTSSDSQPVVDWAGRAENGTLIGIRLFAKDGMPTELEAWSVDGGDVEGWPPIDAIYPT